MVKRAVWLSITPEPERELPWAVATLAAGGRPAAEAVAAESTRIERLVLRGTRRRWLAYLHHVVGLIRDSAGSGDEEVARARAVASAVIANHHALMRGLPGSASAEMRADEALLAAAPGITTNREDANEHDGLADDDDHR